MLAIFPIQEFLATDADLSNRNIDNERINNPAVFLITGATECIFTLKT